jgi:phytoene dehydrogenase-like protein
LLHYFRGRHSERLAPYRDLTVRQALDRYFADHKLKLLLTADCGHWGSPPCRTSFVFDSMLRLSYFLGNYYPRGGSQAFADELAQRFEQRGGHILMNSPVRRILVEEGRACGIEVESGPRRQRRVVRVGAEVVVSNADLLQTLEHMLEPEHLEPDYLQSIRQLRPSAPCFLIHLGLEGVPTEVLERVQGYYWDSWDADELGRDGFRFKIFVPTLYEPGMAPPGNHVLIVQKMVDVDYDAVADWGTHKAAVERRVMAHLEEMIPGLAAKVVVKNSASALTSYRFTGNYQGAMLGWEMAPDQLGDKRPGIAGPLKNFYLTGHWVRPGGGITPVIVSAMQVAEAVLGNAGGCSRF